MKRKTLNSVKKMLVVMLIFVLFVDTVQVFATSNIGLNVGYVVSASNAENNILDDYPASNDTTNDNPTSGEESDYPTLNDNATEVVDDSPTANDYPTLSDDSTSSESGTASPPTVSVSPFVLTSAGGTVAPGDIVHVQENIYGNITVDGTLFLDENFTITGSVTVRNGGQFYMSDGLITGLGSRGVTVTGSNSLFVMSGGAIEGNSVVDTVGGGLSVASGGRAEISGYASISNNTSSGSGGGVRVIGAAADGTPSIIVLNGGVIDNNHALGSGSGGGVLVEGGGQFYMYDGAISNNTAQSSGGAISTHNGTVTILGGDIHGNISFGAAGGAGIRVVAGSVLTMYGGNIFDNHTSDALTDGGGVSINGGTMVMHGGYIFNNSARDGGGVDIRSSNSFFTMYGGTIGHDDYELGNIARDGAGLRVTARATVTFTEHGTGRIIGNTATRSGGGIHALGNSAGIPTLIDMYSGQIYNNSAQNGGGLHVTSNYAIINFHNGTIGHDDPNMGNRASVNGGGVWLGGVSSPTFYMPLDSTGSIHGNTAASNGGGVHLNTAAIVFTMYGGIIGHENNASGNAATNGAGININAGASFTMPEGSNAQVLGNNAINAGGGVNLVGAGSSINMYDGAIISGNTAVNGGGISVSTATATAFIYGGYITENYASVDGGGIWTISHHYHRWLPATAYNNLSITEDVVFSGNIAGNGSFEPPVNWYITNIVGDNTSPMIEEHRTNPLNNYDVNFRAYFPLLTKTAEADEDVYVGDSINYTISVVNEHNFALLGNFTVVDILETQFVELVANSVTVTRNGSPIGATVDLSTNGIVRVVLQDLPANSETLINFDVVVRPQASGNVVRNSAVLHRPGSGTGIGETPDINPITTPATETPIGEQEPNEPPPRPTRPPAPIPPPQEPTPEPTTPDAPTPDEPTYDSGPSRPNVLDRFPGAIMPEHKNEEPPRFEVSIPVPTIPFSHIHHAYMIGDNYGNIRPNADITRAEITTILFRLISDEYRVQMWSQINSFSDVDNGSWFNNAVSTMANSGVIMGMPSGNFEPNRAVTRGELAVMMARFFMWELEDTTNVFPDVEGHWAAEEINALAGMGWIVGFPDGTFMPDQFITRAEVAAILNRILQRLPKSADHLLSGMVTWPDNMDTTAWFYLYIQEATNSSQYVRYFDSNYKMWIGLIEPKNWQILEQPNSNPKDISLSSR